MFDEYRQQLGTRQLKEVDDACCNAAAQLSTEAMAAEVAGLPVPSIYASVIVDETQDSGPQALRLLRALLPRY